MNHFSKPPRTADELLKLLKERNLTIKESEEIEVKCFIRSIGYFRLSGYFGPLQESKNVFKKGTSFYDILRLYKFDCELRELTFRALTLIEVELRARMTDIFSLAYECFWYKNDYHFEMRTERITVNKCYIEDEKIVERTEQVDTPMYKNLYAEIMSSMNKTEHSEFMTKFRAKYSPDSPIPSWMVAESISFGKLSRLYSLLKNSKEKSMIADHFGAITSEYFTSWLHAFVILRNICAHHARLWNKKIGKDIKMPTRRKNVFLSSVNEENIRRYYGVSSCLLKVFKSINYDFMIEYKKRFHKLLEDYDIDVKALGFPENYRQDEIWNMDGI